MKKKILKIVITFAAVIFLVAASVVPSFAVTDMRDFSSIVYDMYEGMFSFNIRYANSGQSRVIYSKPLYFGQITGNRVLMGVPNYFDGDTPFYSNEVKPVSEAWVRRGGYSIDFSEGISYGFEFCSVRVNEDFYLPDDQLIGNSFSVELDSFVVDGNVIDYFDGNNYKWLLSLSTGDFNTFGSINYSYTATSLVDGGVFSYSGSNVVNGNTYMIVNTDYLPNSVYVPPSEPESGVGPVQEPIDWSLYRVDNFVANIEIEEGNIGYFYITNHVLAYANDDSINYKSFNPEIYSLVLASAYSEDYTTGYNAGYNVGNTVGYNKGYNVGYASGFGETNPSFTTWLGNAISGILSVQLFGWFGLGDLFLVVLSILLIILFVKLFAGG